MQTTCTEETRQCIEDTDIDEDIEQLKLKEQYKKGKDMDIGMDLGMLTTWTRDTITN